MSENKTIQFAKYHGLGNDFIIVRESEIEGQDLPALTKRICARTTGIGADGLIIVKEEPLEMIIYNSDGSSAPMCGNGIRCFAEYCYDEGISKYPEYDIVTMAGVMKIRVKSFKPFLVEVNMGKPDYDSAHSGIDTDLSEFLDQTINVDGEHPVRVSTFFMGTIHTVIWFDSEKDTGAEETEGRAVFEGEITIESSDTEEDAEDSADETGRSEEESKALDYGISVLGGEISEHPIFKEKTNVNFVWVLDDDLIEVVTYERGAGLTAACGTGACAAVVLGIKEGKLLNDVTVQLKYGELYVRQDEDGEVYMTGPSEIIAYGEYLG